MWMGENNLFFGTHTHTHIPGAWCPTAAVYISNVRVKPTLLVVNFGVYDFLAFVEGNNIRVYLVGIIRE